MTLLEVGDVKVCGEVVVGKKIPYIVVRFFFFYWKPVLVLLILSDASTKCLLILKNNPL